MKKILLVDDDRDICFLLNRFLTRKGYAITELYSGKKAIAWLESHEPDLILSDFRLEDMDGAQLLSFVKTKYPRLPVIILTGYADIKTAVQMMKMGAVDYMTKPLLPDEIIFTIQQAIETREKIPSENNGTKLTQPENGDSSFQPSSRYIFGNSDTFKTILQQIDLVGPTNYSVIIYGETGSGKESIAQKIHQCSKRGKKPFVAIDCGTLSKELAASELFGHEKGAFTGALLQKAGCFELANGGTIFLDEVLNLSYDVQVSLLRVIQERQMRRVGGTQDIVLDVRIIVASNEQLWNATRNGKFREDLYHRFNEFSIEIPPLRERKEDIMLFANHFLQSTNEELGKKVEGFSKEVESIFISYFWPGNLRELKNVVKKATLLTQTDQIEIRSLPFEISNFKTQSFLDSEASTIRSNPGHLNDSVLFPHKYAPSDISLKEASIDAEYAMIMHALKESNYNKSKAAQLLKIDRKTKSLISIPPKKR
jgi:two-component system, NtrC family, response regulator HydG